MEKEMNSTKLLGNTLDTDYKAEFLAASLLQQGASPDEVRIIRLGRQKGGKSVDRIVREYSSDELIDYQTIYVRKRDLYDSLPEALFHRNLLPEEKKGKQGVLDSMKKGGRETFNARFFFKPFEMAIDRMAVMAHLYELRLTKKDRYDDFVHLLDSHWAFLRDIPLEKALFLVHFLSQSFRLKTPLQVEKVLSVYLDCEVKITLEMKSITIADESIWSLGKGRLGMTTFMSGGMTDVFPMAMVHINGLPRKYKSLLFPSSSAYCQLLKILDLFLPADAELSIHINVSGEDACFVLSDNLEHIPLLGFTTVLS